jgi:hypothetical protein
MIAPEDPRRRPRSNPMPPFVWLILGALVVALFVLALLMMRPPPT